MAPTPLPALSSLRAAAGSVPRHVRFPVVSMLSAPRDPSLSDLLGPAVLVRCVLHPGLEAWLEDAGWSRSAASSQIWRPGGRVRSLESGLLDPLRPLFGPEVLGALVSGSGSRVVLPVVSAFLEGCLVFRPGRIEVRVPDRMLSYGEVVRAWSDGVPGLLAGDDSWFAFGVLGRSALVIRRSTANPVRAEVLCGGSVEDVSATAALSIVESRHLEIPVALDPDVLDVAAMAAAGPSDRVGLFPEQDAMVSALLATDVGAVLASPPGSGKTVVVAVALSELPGGCPSLVVCPPSVMPQWVAELGKWAPGLRVGVARDAASVTGLLHSRDVVVVSSQVAARWVDRSRARVGVLVVDEAVSLLRGSRTARSLRSLRARASAGWALTGSPSEIGAAGGVARLVEWARSPGVPVAGGEVGDFVPVVVGAGRSYGVPVCRTELLGVPPTPGELSALRAELAAPSASLAGLAGAREVQRRRRSLALPGPAEVSSKVASVSGLVVEAVAAGSRVLLFASSSDLLEEYVAHLPADVPATVLPGPRERAMRVRALSAFADGSLPVLAVSPSSQRGVNLQHADVVVHLDLPMSAGEFAQRNGRAARIGSRHASVRVVLPCWSGTLDEEIAAGFLSGGLVHDVAGRLLSEF